MAYEFLESDYELLGLIAITKNGSEKNRLIRQLCEGKPIPRPVKGLSKKKGTLGYSPHNARIDWLNKNSPGWNDPIPNDD